MGMMKTTRSKGYRLEMINKVLPVHSAIPKIRLLHYNSLIQTHISTPFAIDRKETQEAHKKTAPENHLESGSNR